MTATTDTTNCVALHIQAVMANNQALTLALRSGTLAEIRQLNAEHDVLAVAPLHAFDIFDQSVLVGYSDDFHGGNQAVHTIVKGLRCTICGHTILDPLV